MWPKEAKGNTTAWTAKLANYSRNSRNHARDFYRNNPLPVEQGSMNKSTFWWSFFVLFLLGSPNITEMMCFDLRNRYLWLSKARTNMTNQWTWSFQFCYHIKFWSIWFRSVNSKSLTVWSINTGKNLRLLGMSWHWNPKLIESLRALCGPWAFTETKHRCRFRMHLLTRSGGSFCRWYYSDPRKHEHRVFSYFPWLQIGRLMFDQPCIHSWKR